MSDLSFYRGRSVLVSGSTGYIGSPLVERLWDAGANVIPWKRDELGARHLDIDVVFHLASQTSAYASNERPIDDLHDNVEHTLRLLDFFDKQKRSIRFVFASTASLAGLSPICPVASSSPSIALGMYEMHKHMSEQYVAFYVRERGMMGASLRLANVYGPGPKSSSKDRGILNLMIRRALQGGPLTVYGDGQYCRDYVYIDDVVSAFLEAGIHAHRLQGGHYYIGSGQGTMVANAIGLARDTVERVAHISSTVEHVPPPPGLLKIEERHFVADPKEFLELTNWSPAVMLQEGIERTVRSML